MFKIFSFYGASLSCEGPYPYYHSMGPRDAKSCAQQGREQGYLFYVIGSTDHHFTFPGSYNSGRMGVWVESLRRDGVWKAIESRRTVALTGDRIQVAFTLNAESMGAGCPASKVREMSVAIMGGDRIDHVYVLYNNTLIHREYPIQRKSKSNQYKIFLEMGWTEKSKKIRWQVEINVSHQKNQTVEPQFRGYTGK